MKRFLSITFGHVGTIGLYGLCAGFDSCKKQWISRAWMLEASPDGGCELDSFALWGVGDSGGCGCCDLYDGCWCGNCREAD